MTASSRSAGVQMRCLRTKEYYRADKWRGTGAEEGGSVLINQAIHYIDQLQWQMGGAEAVSGIYANLTHGDVIETEDTAVAAIRFAIEVRDRKHLAEVIRRVRRLAVVHGVQRL